MSLQGIDVTPPTLAERYLPWQAHFAVPRFKPMTVDPLRTQALDAATLSRLRQLEDASPGIIAKVVDGFITNQAQFIDEAPGLIATGDFDALRIRVHALRGAAASLGAMSLAAAALTIERGALTPRSITNGDLTELRAEFERACALLAAWAAAHG